MGLNVAKAAGMMGMTAEYLACCTVSRPRGPGQAGPALPPAGPQGHCEGKFAREIIPIEGMMKAARWC